MKMITLLIYLIAGILYNGSVYGQAHDEHEDRILLNKEQMKEYGIEVGVVEKGQLKETIEVPGEIRVNGDQMAHIVSRVSGVVVKVYKKLGDRVQKGDILADIDSRELAEAKALYLAALERKDLAKSIFDRESKLWERKITSEQEYLNAKKNMAEAGIELQTATQNLFALGFTKSYIGKLPETSDSSFTRFSIKAPFSGTIINKHITRGEVLREDTQTFTLADLTTVWVDLQIYQKDLSSLKEGQRVRISTQTHQNASQASIAYLSPMVNEATRTVLARIILPNPTRSWRPGLFVIGEVMVGVESKTLVVPEKALQSFEGKKVVFVLEDGGFEPRDIETGRTDGQNVEILKGLREGERIVIQGAFSLKSELGKSELDSEHSH